MIASQQGHSVFEQAFGCSSASFTTVADVNDFIKQRRESFTANPNLFSKNNFVIPQGNVFSISTNDINNMIDNTLEEQRRCLKRLR